MDQWYNEETYYVTSSDTDAAYEYKASAIFVLLQKVMSQHARNLILNRDEIINKYNCCWMALRTWVKMIRPVIWAETVTAKTVIRKPVGKRLHWDCYMYVGEELVGMATSIWVMVNMATKTAPFSASASVPISTKEVYTLTRRPGPSCAPNLLENTAPLPMHSPSRMEVRKVISV